MGGQIESNGAIQMKNCQRMVCNESMNHTKIWCLYYYYCVLTYFVMFTDECMTCIMLFQDRTNFVVFFLSYSSCTVSNTKAAKIFLFWKLEMYKENPEMEITNISKLITVFLSYVLLLEWLDSALTGMMFVVQQG